MSLGLSKVKASFASDGSLIKDTEARSGTFIAHDAHATATYRALDEIRDTATAEK
jgi:hypothetical protein